MEAEREEPLDLRDPVTLERPRHEVRHRDITTPSHRLRGTEARPKEEHNSETCSEEEHQEAGGPQVVP